ncbi:MAG: PKD domain-containing protein, partial [Thermoplasmata archaeon]|nr:PKD domain-containing protein [Thermoplasmata archaeon]
VGAWAFKAGNWTNLTPYITTEPPARFSAGITNISSNGTLVMVDGCLGQGCLASEDLPDTWLYNWNNVNATLNLSHQPRGLGDPTAFQVHATGGTGAYSYAYAGLPQGCASANVPVLGCNATAPGNFTVSVQVSDSHGHSVVLSLNLTVPGQIYVPPVGLSAALSLSAIDLGQSTVLTASPTGGSGGAWTLSYAALPPGCVSQNVIALTCTPSAAGTYHIVATAISAPSGSASTIVSLTVHPAVAVSESFSLPAIDLGQTVTIGATAAFGSASYTYAWSLLPPGCASTGSMVAIDCVPSATGVWGAAVTATDSLGQSASAGGLSVTVNSRPAVAASAMGASATDPLAVALTALTAGGTGPFTIEWNFGDGSVGTGASATHTYAVAGTYTAEVWYNDSVGVSSTSTLSFAVHASLPISHPPSSPAPPSNLWPARLGGDAGLGILLGLLALGAVGGWGYRRRRSLADGRALVDRLGSASAPSAALGEPSDERPERGG